MSFRSLMVLLVVLLNNVTPAFSEEMGPITDFGVPLPSFDSNKDINIYPIKTYPIKKYYDLLMLAKVSGSPRDINRWWKDAVAEKRKHLSINSGNSYESRIVLLFTDVVAASELFVHYCRNYMIDETKYIEMALYFDIVRVTAGHSTSWWGAKQGFKKPSWRILKKFRPLLKSPSMCDMQFSKRFRYVSFIFKK